MIGGHRVKTALCDACRRRPAGPRRACKGRGPRLPQHDVPFSRAQRQGLRQRVRRPEGVACHVSQARTGGIKGGLGLAEDPSRFSIACRQIGPMTADITKLPDQESVYSEQTSIFFKHTHVFRIVDKKRNTLVYVALSDKIIEGSPQNSLSTVPVMPWGK
jgi:hypothetical protein